jgi:hypothetical protein
MKSKGSRAKFKVGDILSWENPRRLSSCIDQSNDYHNTGHLRIFKRSLFPLIYKIHSIEQYGNLIIYRFDEWYYAEKCWRPPMRDVGCFQNNSIMECKLKKANKLELLLKHNIT